ncbi:RDD family protein [Microbacterium sp. B35-30]|uniref:RDD family protein n=1 Tax=Microbacterium sp. B35-30 TaxID=1962642 RepID=UPI0013CF5C6D|nr:RDD family protein [Microbacterium sp. B35-30]
MIWEIDDSTHTVEGLDGRGRPRPEYAASLGLRMAPFGRRVLATSIELGILVVLQLPLLLVSLPVLLAAAASADPAAALTEAGNLGLVIACTAASSALTTAFVVLQLILHGRKGTTVGKAATGIRSVNVRTLERPGFWRGAVVRYLVLGASFLVPLVGPVLVIACSPLFDPERRGRGWADMAGATWFVDVRKGLNPYDVKRMRIARKTAATDLADERSELPSLATSAVAPASGAYIPVTRSSGGVVGAPRGEAQPATTAPGGAGAAAVAPSAAAVDPDAAGAGAPAPGNRASVHPAVASSTAAAGPGPGIPWTPPRLLPDAAPPAGPPLPAAARPAAPARPGQPPVAAPLVADASSPAVVLELDTGARIALPGAGILIGRDPSPAPGDNGLTLVPIEDPTKSISKTHLALLRTGGAIIAVDRASTNGSALIRDGAEHSLPPGQGVTVRSGDTLLLGDRRALIRIG